MLNSMNIVGRPTADPELRYTTEGTAVAQMIVAVQRNFKNANGEYEADFVKVVAWKQGAEYLANYGRKGKLLSVDGSFRSGSYESNEGQTVYTFELHANNCNILEWEENTANNGNSNGSEGGGGGGSRNQRSNNGNSNAGNSNRSGNGSGTRGGNRSQAGNRSRGNDDPNF